MVLFHGIFSSAASLIAEYLPSVRENSVVFVSGLQSILNVVSWRHPECLAAHERHHRLWCWQGMLMSRGRLMYGRVVAFVAY